MKKLLLALAVAILGFAAFSQSSEQISAILKADKVNCAQASYLAAVYTNSITESGSETDAFDALKKNGYFSDDVNADSEITLAQISYLYTKALGIKGGLFYTLFPSPRYAFKELKARDILPTESDPSMKLSGRDCLDLFNSCLSATENGETE